MTSEGQYAGSQPAEATSGGPTPDGYPPDPDGRRISGRASAPPPADGFPSSYAPPPPATPNGGSPFVVPAVRTFGSGSDSAGARPTGAAGTSYGSARVPQPEEGALPQREPAQREASPYGSVAPGNAASPYGTVAPEPTLPASPFSSYVPPTGNAPEPPRSAWAPQTAPADAEGGNPFPLPQRTPAPVDPSTIREFDGFAAGTPGRGTLADPSAPPTAAAENDQAGRPPGLSAFGDQRVRVPGATLTDLPDGPPPARGTGNSGGFPTRPAEDAAARPAESNGFPLRGGGEGSAFPLRGGGEGSGFPLRGGGTAFPLRGGGEGSGFPLRGNPESTPETPAPPTPVGDLPVRSQHAPFNAAPFNAAPGGTPFNAAPGGTPFPAFGGSADEAPDPFGRSGGESFGDPFGRQPGGDAGEQASAEAQRGGLPDPFGRPNPGESFGSAARPPAEPSSGSFGGNDSRQHGAEAPAYGSAGTNSPYGSAVAPFAGSEATPFAAAGPPSAATPNDAFGSARPFGNPPPDGDSRFGGSAQVEGDSRFGGSAQVEGDSRFGGSAQVEGDSRFGGSAATPGSSFGSAQPDGDRFGGSATPGTPFGSATADADSRFGGSATPGSPYGSAPPDGFGGSATPASPYGSATADADSRFGGPATPGSPYGSPQPHGDSSFGGSASPYGSAQPASFGGSATPANTYGSAQSDGFDGGSSQPDGFGSGSSQSDGFGGGSGQPDGFGKSAAESPFGSAQSGGPASSQRGDEQSGDEHSLYRRPDSGDSGSGSGYPQRVPGAALDGLGSPPESRNGSVPAPRDGSVPAPRDPAEPAVGSARPVTASASVPSASRVAPVDPAELPPPAPAPQARVYGRPASAEPAEDEPAAEPEPFTDSDRPAPGNYGTPSGFGAPSGPPSGFGVTSGPPTGFGATSGPPSGFGVTSGPPSGPPSGFGSPAFPQRGGDHNGPDGMPAGNGVAPQSPARASASARVSPPPTPALPAPPPVPSIPDQPRGPSFADLTMPATNPYSPPATNPYSSSEQYSELTTDIAGRNPNDPYQPFPASPNGLPDNGAFGGPASRATVTPPSPDDTTNWPGNTGKFDQFKPESAPAKPETPHVRTIPVLLAVVAGAVLLLGVVFGIVYLVAGGKSDTFSVSTGDCVKRDGSAAVKSDCSDASSFEVTSIVKDKADCADPQQPYVVNPTQDGTNQVLCLKPHSS